MAISQKISPFLWFDGQAEQAAEFYVSVFQNSRITGVSRYSGAGEEIHGGKAGSVMVVSFELEGQKFTALNGGPHFKFDEAISFVVDCADQAEVDYFWEKLGEGGREDARQCGWLKDKFGLSWQIVPSVLPELFTSGDRAASDRVMTAMLQMKKLDIAQLQQAFDGP